MKISEIPCARMFRRSLPNALCVFVLAVLPGAVFGATQTVTNLNDSGAGSLRAAIAAAASGDTIAFSNVVGTITLSSGTLTINTGVIMAGPGANLLTVSGANAVTVFTMNTTDTVNITGLAIANGSSSGVLNGGGIADNDGGSNLIVNNCAFSGNATANGGGAISSGGTLTVENSTFAGNTAAVGGALFSNGGNAIVANDTFFGNSATAGPGGGIFNNGTMTVENSTVDGNSGGGIFNNGNGATLTLTDSIVAGNAGGDCNQCGTQSAYNLIGGGMPALGPLAYNGGATETMMPLPGGTGIIGAGLNSVVNADQRGFLRATSGASDLGAVQTDYLTVTTTADSSDSTTCTGGAMCSLRDAVGIASSDNSGDVIFQTGLTGTITLESPGLDVYGNVNIQGPGANELTVSGNNLGPVLSIGPGVTAAVSGLTLANGEGTPSDSETGGGIEDTGSILTVENCIFSSNVASGGGAAIFQGAGTLMIENSTFSNNSSGNTGIGGGIFNDGLLLVNNSTFIGNQAFKGGGIFNNDAVSSVNDSTFFGNAAQVGGGLFNGGDTVTITNSIVAGNTGGDCYNCTQNGPIVTGVNPQLGPLQLNGGSVPTMLPLPGGPAIQVGDPTQLPEGLTKDGRGFPRLTNGKLDVGAVQTNYTAVQFVQQPTNTVINADITPAVTVEVLETNPNLPGPNNTDAVSGIPITLTFGGAGMIGGTLTQTTAGGVATFGDLSVNAPGTGDTLATSVTVTPTDVSPAQILTATSNAFDIGLMTSTVVFSPPPPASVTYGNAPISLSATVLAGGTPTGQTVTFQVDSGPATITGGNQLNFTGGGTVQVEADSLANNTYGASSVVNPIVVGQAASTLGLTASTNQAGTGQPVILTATATSATAGATDIPTGTVTFLTAGGPLGTANLNAQGVATLSVTTLSIGSTEIAASYSGDNNYTGSGGQLAVPVVVGTPGFSMSSSASTITIQPGQTGTATLTLNPAFGYTGTISFGCNGLPLHSTCSFSPASVAFSGSPITVTVTIATSVHGQTRGGSLSRLEPLHSLKNLPILPCLFLWLPGTMLGLDEEKTKGRKLSGKSGGILLATLLLALGAGMLSLTGCGGTNFNTPAGQQTVTITAAGSGGISQSIQVNVAVQ